MTDPAVCQCSMFKRNGVCWHTGYEPHFLEPTPEVDWSKVLTTGQSQENLVSNNPGEKPSTTFHGDLYVVRLYNDDSVDPHVYEHVKHVWYKNNGQTICICHYYNDGRYRFVFFQASSVRWYQVWPERFEHQE